MNECAHAEYVEADKQLNRVYSETMKLLSPAHQEKLKAAEQAWIPFRDAQCECESFFNEGGSMQPLVRFTCLKGETDARISQLNALAEDARR